MLSLIYLKTFMWLSTQTLENNNRNGSNRILVRSEKIMSYLLLVEVSGLYWLLLIFLFCKPTQSRVSFYFPFILISSFDVIFLLCHRYLAIVRPLKPRMSKASAQVTILVVWLASVVLGSPCLLYSDTITYR